MPSSSALSIPPSVTPPPRVHQGSVRILAWTMALVPTLGVPSHLVLQDTLKSAVLAFGVLLAALLFFWQQRQRTTPLLWHGLVWLPLALMAYALGSMVWSHTYLAGVEAIRWFVLALLLWLGLNTLNRINLPTLLWGIHAGAVGASVWVALQFWWDMDLFPQAAFPASTFVNRNFFAEYAVSVLPLSVYLLLHVRRLPWLGPMAASVALVVVAIMMTGTRSALVALWLLLAVLAVVSMRYRHHIPWNRWSTRQRTIVTAVLAAGIVGLGLVPSTTPRVVAEGTGTTALARSVLRTTSLARATEYTEGSFSVRADMWKSTARMLLAHPLSGVGAGAWEVQIPLYQRADTMIETDYYAHNEYLQLLSEYGLLVGGLFLAILVAYWLVSAGSTWLMRDTQPDGAPVRAFTLASLLALMIVSNAGFPWHLASTGALLVLCLAIVGRTDDELGRTDAFLAQPMAWRPRYRQAAIPLLLGAMALAGYLTQQAVQAERKIVGAIAKAIYLNNPHPPQAPLSPEKQAQMLRDARDGIAIHPHYRKLSAVLADQLAQAGDWANAVWVWESVVASRPHIAAIWRNLAQGHSLLGEHDAAQRALAQVQRLQPDRPATRTLEILLLSRAGKTAQAVEQLQQYYTQRDFSLDMVQMGYALGLQTQQWELAVRSLELRNASWPELAGDGHFRLGMIFAQPSSAVHDPMRAQAEFRQALAALPPQQREAYRRQIPAALRDAQ